MSTHLLFGAAENPGPGVALACINLIVALALVCVSLFLGVTVSLIAWLHALATGEAERRAVA